MKAKASYILRTYNWDIYFCLGNQGRLSQGAEFEQKDGKDGFELAGEGFRQEEERGEGQGGAPCVCVAGL